MIWKNKKKKGFLSVFKPSHDPMNKRSSSLISHEQRASSFEECFTDGGTDFPNSHVKSSQIMCINLMELYNIMVRIVK